MENNTLNECLICLDDVTHDDDFVLCTNCNYYNHYYCSIKWFQTKKNKDLNKKILYAHASINGCTSKPKYIEQKEHNHTFLFEKTDAIQIRHPYQARTKKVAQYLQPHKQSAKGKALNQEKNS